jgi:two-component system, chemotaxis family, CheB/CheR fusion protein
MIRARKQTVKVIVPDAPLVVDADPARLAQIFSNIVGNAVKYTYEGGSITIHAAATEGLASISVADDGVGMSADLVPRVFDLFVQGERTLDRHEGGLGVGLTVAKRLVDLHGGTMSAASAGPGLGSRFTIELPLLDADRVPLDESSAPASASPSRPRRIVVVDDNEDAAEALATLLALLGHEATVLHDGHQALLDAPARRPDVMLLDIGLPGIDGFEVARRVRKMPELDGVRLIACTGYGQIDDLRKMREAGFDRHVVKPVDAAELERVLAD